METKRKAGAARLGAAAHGLAGFGLEGHGAAGMARQGAVSQGTTGQGRAGTAGAVGLASAGDGGARLGRAGTASHEGEFLVTGTPEAMAGLKGLGEAAHDVARRGKAGLGRRGSASPGVDRAGTASHDVAGTASHGAVTRGAEGQAGHGSVRYGLETPGAASLGRQQEEANGSLKRTETIKISEPNFAQAVIQIRGTSPYVQHAFSQKARIRMEEVQRAGSRSRTRKTREARDFEADAEAAKHRSTDGWCGIPASSFRNALISACKIVGFFQTRAKLAIFVLADGMDAVDGTPLVKIQGEPEIHRSYARNESGVADLRWRPMWREWRASVRLTWDADMLSSVDIANLMMRAGKQIGIGEGRPDSPNSNGLGWGTWEVVS